MVYKIADNILSPLGETTRQNYQAVKAGRSAIRCYADRWQLPRVFSAALFSEVQRQAMVVEGLTPFEAMVVCSVRRAVEETQGLPLASRLPSGKTVLILSTTKGNVELLSRHDKVPEDVLLGKSARKIARHLGFTADPIVVCNACISGLSALVLAARLLEAGVYDYAVVCGADCQSRFIVSGFQSFQVVSPNPCRPFDMERTGLSLGEAAATMVLSRKAEGPWTLVSGAVRNDACHISSPAKDGAGACEALRTVTHGFPIDKLAFVNAHGTATMFNDQMEAVAIERAGLSSVPVNGYKGYYGHTMGAAGVLETVLSMAALDDHTILGTWGFVERGVSGAIQLSATHQPTEKQAFVKMLSGFGGGNAAVLYVKDGGVDSGELRTESTPLSTLRHTVLITPSIVQVDGRSLPIECQGSELLTALYRQYVGNYPKYYKMDRLSQLGFVASELLLQAEGSERFVATNKRAVILFNYASSIHADLHYLASIDEPDNFFPSPSVFVYTLPNIVAGEIAIRNLYHGETSFYILPERNEALIQQILRAALADAVTQSVLCGWIDYQDDTHFVADLSIVERVKEE